MGSFEVGPLFIDSSSISSRSKFLQSKARIPLFDPKPRLIPYLVKTARDEAWVPKADRVKISTTNVRIDPTMTHKEETYQVILDIIKNTTFYKAFLATADVPEIFMHQFWHTVTKIKEYTFYDFKLANKKCQFDVEILKIIINHFLSIHKSIPKSLPSSINTVKDDGVLSRMKFVLIGEDFQEYGCAIPETMLTKGIKQSEAYRTFIKYSTGLIPIKKNRGKGLQGKKSVVTPKPANDNILPEPDVTLELGKSMSLNETAKEEAARQVHATHEWIVTESDPEHARRSTRRRPSCIAFRDTSSVSKKTSLDQSQKLKGIQTMTDEEKLAADTMQELKASKKLSKSQPHAGGSSEGAGVSPGVPDESTVILTTSSERAGTKPGVPDEVKGSSEAKADSAIDWGSEEEENILRKELLIKRKTDDDEEFDDEFVHGDEYVHDDVDEEMKDVEDTETRKDNDEITDAEKTEVTKGDREQAGKLPLTSSRLSVSSV
ncbi:hypothetical protein Tco_1332398 [Tanacetum coccineum]